MTGIKKCLQSLTQSQLVAQGQLDIDALDAIGVLGHAWQGNHYVFVDLEGIGVAADGRGALAVKPKLFARIGTDGHIGFNEPTSSVASRTRIKTLTARTRKDNARFFGSEDAVPFHVITMGIGTILDTRKTVLLATGKNKAQAVAQAVEGPITSMNPASALQLHPSAIFCLDEEAASELTRTDYYRWVFDNKPAWQVI
jgi:hypothetical protein